MEGWQQRRTSFGAVAADYALLRPGYPADAVAFLLGSRPLRVLDAVGAPADQVLGIFLVAVAQHDVDEVLELGPPARLRLDARIDQAEADRVEAEVV